MPGRDWLDVFTQEGPEPLRAAAATTRPWTPENVTPEAVPDPDGPHLTDLGNAKRLVASHGNDLRYCDARAGWLVWTGNRWERDVTGEVMRRAKRTVLALYAEAAAIADDNLRKKLVDWARRSESGSRLNAMVALAASELAVVVVPDAWDADHWVLNVANGTIDLRTGVLRLHRREDLITKLAPVIYDPDATLPLWEKFLHDTMSGDAETIAFVQRFAGYALTGDTSEEVLVFAHGPEASGKSTFVEAIKATLGDYALTTDFETFLKRPAPLCQ